MERINGNFSVEPSAGGTKPFGGEITGDSDVYYQKNQKFNPPQFAGDQPTDEARETFWVSKSADAKKISENLLRENFGFDETDVQAYRKLHGEFKIFDDQKCEIAVKAGKDCAAATADDIKNWKTVNGKVSVELKPETVESLRKFRLERVVDKAVNNISDDDLRESVKGDLMRVGASAGGEDRIGAAMRLMNIDGKSAADTDLARQAIKTVAEKPENKNNPVLNILAARIRLEEAVQNKNPREFAEANRQLTNAVRIVQGQDAQTGEFSKDARPPNRAEAAWTNRQAAVLLRKIGNNDAAERRDMLARYYEVDDKERARFESAKFTDLVNLPRWKQSDTPSVHALSPVENDWREYQRQNDPDNPPKDLSEEPFKRVWTVPKIYGEKSVAEVSGEGDAVKNPQNFKGKITNRPLDEYQREGSLRVEGTLQIERTTYFTKKGRTVPLGRPYDYSQIATVNRTMRSPELNPEGTTSAMGVGGAVALIDDFNKWGSLAVDYKLDITSGKIALRDRLERGSFNAQNYPVPPKPEDLPKERQKLVRMLGTDKKAEAQVNERMRELKELSYAFWGRR